MQLNSGWIFERYYKERKHFKPLKKYQKVADSGYLKQKQKMLRKAGSKSELTFQVENHLLQLEKQENKSVFDGEWMYKPKMLYVYSEWFSVHFQHFAVSCSLDDTLFTKVWLMINHAF